MSFFRKGGILLALLGAVFFWMLGYGQMAYLPQNSMTTYHQIATVDEKQAEDMRQKEQKTPIPMNFTLWNQKNGQRITGIETGRTEQVSAVNIRGDSRLLFAQSARLADNDTKGCLIDKATANALFGHSQAVGASISYEGVDFVVRGVLGYPKGTLVLLGNQRQVYSQLTLPALQGEGDTFALRHGVSWQLKTNSAGVSQLARVIVSVPLLVFLLYLVFFLASHKRNFSPRVVPITLISLGMWALITLFFYLLLHTIPSSSLPAKWSDFMAWNQRFDQTGEFFSAYLSQPRSRPELGDFGAMAKTLWALLAIPFLSIAFGLYRGRQIEKKGNR